MVVSRKAVKRKQNEEEKKSVGAAKSTTEEQREGSNFSAFSTPALRTKRRQLGAPPPIRAPPPPQAACVSLGQDPSLVSSSYAFQIFAQQPWVLAIKHLHCQDPHLPGFWSEHSSEDAWRWASRLSQDYSARRKLCSPGTRTVIVISLRKICFEIPVLGVISRFLSVPTTSWSYAAPDQYKKVRVSLYHSKVKTHGVQTLFHLPEMESPFQ
ncbi:hypothetical protein BDV12DRAFT_85558 [Aspergillus spectabilis]